MWPLIEKQRRILSGEQGAIVKERGGKTSVALVYPNTYDVGMGNLAVHSLYKLLNDSPNIVCERAFLPAARDMKEHERTRTPVLTVETQRPISEFDVIAFSISFQNDFLNILPILERSSIPHRSSHRKKSHPLLIAGGCAVTINFRPLEDMFDAFVIGEAEEIVSDIVPIIAERSGRNETLEAISKIEGIHVPGFSAIEPKRLFVKDLDAWPTQTVVYAPDVEFGDLHLIETGRGCPRRCKFCVTPCIYAPLRFRGFDAIQEMVHTGLPFRKRFGLIGSDLLSHPAIFDVIDEIHGLDATFSPSSLCVDEIDDKVAALLAKSGHRSISLGVEAASDALRFAVGKKFPRERIIEAIGSLAKHGILSVRLYFMIGLPDETEDDVKAIADVGAEVQKILHKTAPKSARSTSVSLTITPFVPKPLTPFENAKFAGEKYLKKALATIKKLTAKTKGIAVHSDPVISSVCDALLSSGDRNIIAFLEEAHKMGLRPALSRRRETE